MSPYPPARDLPTVNRWLRLLLLVAVVVFCWGGLLGFILGRFA